MNGDIAIWDDQAQWWYCPTCHQPLTEDGPWADDDYELDACHSCAVEYWREAGDTTKILREGVELE
jgi:hypothetical protein